MSWCLCCFCYAVWTERRICCVIDSPDPESFLLQQQSVKRFLIYFFSCYKITGVSREYFRCIVICIIILLSQGFDLESSDDSGHDYDDDVSGARESGFGDGDEFTTSWEDMSKLDPNLLLYKASGARNLPVMLEALSNRADPNWVNMEDEGKTPIMRAVQTVRFC